MVRSRTSKNAIWVVASRNPRLIAFGRLGVHGVLAPPSAMAIVSEVVRFQSFQEMEERPASDPSETCKVATLAHLFARQLVPGIASLVIGKCGPRARDGVRADSTIAQERFSCQRRTSESHAEALCSRWKLATPTLVLETPASIASGESGMHGQLAACRAMAGK